MNPFLDLPLWVAVAAFISAALVITLAGTRMAETADRLADRTGIGEALIGGVLLGASTSLPGIVASTAAAAHGHAELAFSNAIGGIAVQTFFLTIADAAYRRANLEHAAASLTNLTQAVVLMTLLTLPILAGSLPSYTLFGVHPATFGILIGYAIGIQLAIRARKLPMWGPRQTKETRRDVPDEPKGERRVLVPLLVQFAALATVLIFTGYVTASSGIAIAAKTGISQGLVGAYFTAIVTSMPELVTTIAAVRRGALTLAMGGIVGGNIFDMLFIASSDIAYREGSLYHAVSSTPYFLTALSILMIGVLVLGMLQRERRGVANIGFESALVFALYIGGTALLVARG